MIQRIQSIFLLLAAICLGLLFLDAFNFGIAESVTTNDTMLSDGDLDASDHVLMSGLAIAGIIVSLVSIFLFNNRKLQSNVTMVSFFIISMLHGAAGFYFHQNSEFAESLNGSLEFSFGWACPFLALVFAVLALRGIGKDEKLVKSMDRLR